MTRALALQQLWGAGAVYIAVMTLPAEGAATAAVAAVTLMGGITRGMVAVGLTAIGAGAAIVATCIDYVIDIFNMAAGYQRAAYNACAKLCPCK